MRHEQFQRLVANIREDGHLTSTPLVWHDADSGRRIVLSGNHPTKAAIEAGLSTIFWLEVTDPLPRQKQIALQLSHNAITGEDDPATVKALYEELEDVSMRLYSGLDDKTLDLLDEVSVPSSRRPTWTSRRYRSCSRRTRRRPRRRLWRRHGKRPPPTHADSFPVLPDPADMSDARLHAEITALLEADTASALGLPVPDPRQSARRVLRAVVRRLAGRGVDLPGDERR
jgi:hypothetical protein